MTAQSDYSWKTAYTKFASELLKLHMENDAKLQSLLLKAVPLCLKELQDGHYSSTTFEKLAAGVKNGMLTEFDPFTVIGLFNVHENPEPRKAIFNSVCKTLEFKIAAPTGFDGVPVPGRDKSVFSIEEKVLDNGKTNKLILWNLFSAAISLADSKPNPSDPQKKEFFKFFDEAEKLKGISWNLIMALFWIRPDFFMTLDEPTRDYLKKPQHVPEAVRQIVEKWGKKLPNGTDYLTFLDKLTSEMKKDGFSKIYGYSDFAELSHSAPSSKDSTNSTKGGGVLDQTDNFADTPHTASDSNLTPLEQFVEDLLLANFNVILTGAPGTGKTYTAKQVAKAMVGAIVPEDATEAEKNAAKTAEEERIQSVQFHPGYDYSDFVIGMKPKLVGEKGKEQVAFEWKDGVFKTFADKAKADPDNNYVFIIDEINRADLSRVFGELFSLLEEEYRYPQNPKGITLPNGKNFVIPKNLYIIGTMNDIDRSVESMDFALRRRFAWKEIKASDSQNIIDAKAEEGKITKRDKARLKGAMKALNNLIAPPKADEQPDANQSAKAETPDLRLGREYQLGGAIFAKLEKYVKDADGYVHDATPDTFNALWSNHIENILSEYLRGRRDRDDTLESLHKAYQEACKKEVDFSKDEEGVADPGSADESNISEANRNCGKNKKFQINYHGDVIKEKDGTKTLVAFVEKLNDKEIQTLANNSDIQRAGRYFLVTNDPLDGENYTYVDKKGCYIVTKSDTQEKINQVNQIAGILDLENVRAEPVDD